MTSRIKLPVTTVLALAVVSLSCSAAKGACVRESGITSSCGNDLTSGSCNLGGGTAFYENMTCADLGFTQSNRTTAGENPE